MKATRAVRTPGGRALSAVGGPVEAAGAAYRAARTEAAARSPLMLRWRTRTLLRSRAEGCASEADLIELRALVDEDRARGGELLA